MSRTYDYIWTFHAAAWGTQACHWSSPTLACRVAGQSCVPGKGDLHTGRFIEMSIDGHRHGRYLGRQRHVGTMRACERPDSTGQTSQAISTLRVGPPSGFPRTAAQAPGHAMIALRSSLWLGHVGADDALILWPSKSGQQRYHRRY